jgi:hypothetical protein
MAVANWSVGKVFKKWKLKLYWKNVCDLPVEECVKWTVVLLYVW